MPRNIRKYEKDRVYLITNRVAEGLPFVPTILINLFIYGIIARAICLHPNVKACHFIFMGKDRWEKCSASYCRALYSAETVNYLALPSFLLKTTWDVI